MALSQELIEILPSAFNALAQQPKGELPLAFRRRLWKAMGPRLRDSSDWPQGAGWQRRTRLALLCVQKVLPLWQQAHSHDDQPQQIVALAEQLLQGTISREMARRKRDELDSEIKELADEDRNFVARYVGDTAVNAAVTAQVDEDIDDFDVNETDDDLEPDAWDAGYTAAMAYSGGAWWEEGSSVEQRRNFWHWYLEQAVPIAYSSVLD